MEGESTPESLLVPALQSLTELFQVSVEEASECYKASSNVYEFLEFKGHHSSTGLTSLSKVVFGYAECFKKLGVGTRAEMEKLWGEHLGNPDVKEAVDALLKAKKSWMDVVAEVESKLTIEEDKLTIKPPASTGKQLPKDLCLVESSSGCSTNLESLWKESKYTLFVYLRHFG